jgi:hypothetical protein
VSESPRRHSEKRNGPVPTGWPALWEAESGETMIKDPNARDCSKPPERRRSEIFRVCGSIASTSRTARRRDFWGFTESAANALSKENFAAEASKGRPS